MFRTLLPLFCLLLATSSDALAQDYDLAGARRPKPDMSLKRSDQYKRVHQVTLRYMLRDRADEAREYITRYIDEHPDDAESRFLLGLLDATAGNPQQAAAAFEKALDNGLPPGRLIAGPRELIAPVRNEPLLKRVFADYAAVPVHGPLVGHTTDTSVSIWVRTAQEAAVRVVVGTGPELKNAITSPPVTARAENDYTAVVTVEGLQPHTGYHYAIQIGDGPRQLRDDQHFRTFPTAGKAAKFVLAFGGGAGYVPPHERMWDTIRKTHPLALLLLGDNVYIDDPESPEMQRYTYYRRQSRPEWRQLTAQTSVYTIWDDHDFSTNDSWGGPQIDQPFWKRDYAWTIYRENWANPGYAGGYEQPGCWYRFAIGDVDFIMLDCRYYRTNPRGDQPTMLGPVQMEWLKSQLLDCRGTFKVICSSVPWDYRTKGDSRDTWNGYQGERDEIFGFLAKHDIDGVVLMSADRHRSDAWKIERPGSYPLYEFNSSRLTNQHVHPTMEKQGAIFSYNAKQSFGLVHFDTTADDPSVTYDVISIDGERVHSLTVRRSELE